MRLAIQFFVILCIFNPIYASAQSTHPHEVAALKSIKSKLIDPMKHLVNWKKGDPCTSHWNGVLCFRKLQTDGFFHVREIQLLNMNLSGILAPEVGNFTHMQILDLMWNKLTGTIPKEIGNLSSLTHLLLNGNQFSGSVPDELGFLVNLDRLQLDENNLSGAVPKSLANMVNAKHFHLNNNSFSGLLPPEFSQLPKIAHLLLDNNNLSGNLPPEYSALAHLEILQLDNNHFDGAEIPKSYQNLSRLVKLSLRNCSLGGAIPDLSRMPYLSFIDLSWNKLTGPIPSNKLSDSVTTINLSHNNLNGSIPESFSLLPDLQMLWLLNNSINGSIPTGIWHNKSFNATARLSVDLRYNLLSNISGDLNPPQNVTLRLRGNPVCNRANLQNIHLFCDSDGGGNGTYDGRTTPTACYNTCPVEQYFEPVPEAPECFCAAPIRIGYRLKSPSFTYFPPYKFSFESYITHNLKIHHYQLLIDSYAWEEGPRLRMYLKLFPVLGSNHTFNESEIYHIRHIYTTWNFSGSDIFGPYELLNFTLLGPYSYVNLETGKNGISKSVLAAIMVGLIMCVTIASVLATILIIRRKSRSRQLSRKNMSSKISMKIDGVKEFTFRELLHATNHFNSSAQVGRGGYGKVYKGILANGGAVVAVKRAEDGSLQGKHEFLTEIQFLSRLHHRNLVSLVGYCSEADEQVLVYEYMPNGTLRDWLSGKSERTLNFVMRLRIALGAARGVLYLHTEANPPIFHRDIKASNILLDANLTTKVADFGLSHLAPVMDDEGSVPHHISTIVKGTPGYLDPEYFLTHQLTDKSDVYSLGVVFLELLTGVPPISHGKNLVREVNAAQKSGSLFDIIDSKMGDYPSECVERFIELALRCCQDKPEMRPSMLDVVRELENLLQLVPDSMIMSNTSSLQFRSSSSTTTTSLTNVSKFARMSSDVSGSDLTTTVLPTITPR
ncbi:probable LRR receptor-like serine/threonine-protein kinase At1g06840 [Chenopodium quinoa]|uniref:probable LRR receptor-like serine/threonine-protein kinase At1g06840 n=1 Tax=Chenopodium quinoa TaxID=63459 RepID=UPI000B786128|nr:probable LRR receptor-like serine/threonine-protein kinase At1g06840 [Chenopodium quinoa]